MIEHRLKVQAVTLRTGRTYYLAACSCGWKLKRKHRSAGDARTSYGNFHGVNGQLSWS